MDKNTMLLLRDGLIDGEICLFQLMSEPNLDSDVKFKIVLDEKILSQLTLRTFASKTAIKLLDIYKKDYGLLPPKVLSVLKLLTRYQDKEDVCWKILEKQQGIVIAHKTFDPEMAVGIASIAYRLFLAYVEVETMYEAEVYSCDDKARNVKPDFFVEQANDTLLNLLQESIQSTLN